ncbi:MAG: DUF2442 domain-containing protein [Pseudomonadota bacterium]
MTTLAFDMKPGIATQVRITDAGLIVELLDGRTITVPLAWYPRLFRATAAEQNNWRFIGKGEGIHWPDLDEDVSVADLLMGKPSGESQRSFERWKANRAAAGRS